MAPETPGSIHEGGELGYSLSHAYGAAFDNPDLLVACVIGDGEAETGPLATSWHSNKFLNPATDGAVLPILHLNGYKIASPTVLARIGREGLESLLRGYGYNPYSWKGDDPQAMHQLMAGTLDATVDEIRKIQKAARRRASPIALDGRWSCCGRRRAGPGRRKSTGRRPRIPGGRTKCRWARCTKTPTRPDSRGLDAELSTGRAVRRERALAARACRTRAQGRAADGRQSPRQRGPVSRTALPDFRDYAVDVPAPGATDAEATRVMGHCSGVMKRNLEARNFRLFSPGREQLQSLAGRPRGHRSGVERPSAARTMITSLSTAASWRCSREHQCQGWLEGYLLTGRHGFFSCYEAFIHIVDSMVNQHAKWLKVCGHIPWRRPIASLNCLLLEPRVAAGPQRIQPSRSRLPRSRRQQEGRHRPRISSARRQLPLERHRPLPAQPRLHQRRRCRQTARAAMADHGAGGRHCTAGIGIWELGRQRARRRARCGDGLLLVTCRRSRRSPRSSCSASGLPDLKVRVVNVVDLMTLQPSERASARTVPIGSSTQSLRRTSRSSLPSTAIPS